MSLPTVLILPGVNNSGEGHWQTVWECAMPNARRVAQTEWDAPHCTEWIKTLDNVIRHTNGNIVLVAHSLGCALTVAWSELHGGEHHASRIRGALLVAPPDVERTDFPENIKGFAPMPQKMLRFQSIVVASSNDPWCALDRAELWAKQWSASFHHIGAKGHINGSSGLGDWPEGQRLLEALSRP